MYSSEKCILKMGSELTVPLTADRISALSAVEAKLILLPWESLGDKKTEVDGSKVIVTYDIKNMFSRNEEKTLFIYDAITLKYSTGRLGMDSETYESWAASERLRQAFKSDLEGASQESLEMMEMYLSNFPFKIDGYKKFIWPYSILDIDELKDRKEDIKVLRHSFSYKNIYNQSIIYLSIYEIIIDGTTLCLGSSFSSKEHPSVKEKRMDFRLINARSSLLEILKLKDRGMERWSSYNQFPKFIYERENLSEFLYGLSLSNHNDELFRRKDGKYFQEVADV